MQISRVYIVSGFMVELSSVGLMILERDGLHDLDACSTQGSTFNVQRSTLSNTRSLGPSTLRHSESRRRCADVLLPTADHTGKKALPYSISNLLSMFFLNYNLPWFSNLSSPKIAE